PLSTFFPWTVLGEDHEVCGMVAPFGLLRGLLTRQVPVVPRSQDCKRRMPHRTRGVLLGGVGGAPVRRSWAMCSCGGCAHSCYPPSSSSKALASWRSAVSNPSLNQP